MVKRVDSVTTPGRTTQSSQLKDDDEELCDDTWKDNSVKSAER